MVRSEIRFRSTSVQFYESLFAAQASRCRKLHNLAKAQYKLADSYLYGTGVPRDVREAVKWFCQAAEQGVAEAQYNLGVMYANGDGVP